MTKFKPDYLVHSFRTPSFDCRERFKELGNDVYFANVFSDEFCEHILGRVTDFERECKTDAPETANSMHWNAIPSKQLGIEPLVQSFVELFYREISHHFLPERLRIPIDTVHSYIVQYSNSSDRDLGFHVDDSLLTLNICLNDGFTGSELVFEGERCPIHVDTSSSPGEQITIEHKKGSMVVHPGKNRHYVNNISRGERYNLIIWCQSEIERNRWFDALKTGECLKFCGMNS